MSSDSPRASGKSVPRERLSEIRLDKWLWAARLFKTRPLAAEAAAGGKVHVNGARAKPAKAIRVDDELRVRNGDRELVVTVRGLTDRRRPASEASLLYEETETSKQAREAATAARRAEAAATALRSGRPSKKDRRDIRKFTRDHP
jgi:ribosome-associated heat shock protein Hsp15